jgi:hypothetical protein
MRELSSQTGAGSQNSLNAEFGLGDAVIIDSIIVEWSSGIVWDTTDIYTDQFLTIKDTRIAGCMDDGQQTWSPYPGIEACNHKPDAQGNNGSCKYIDECGECSGASIFNQYLDCNSVCYGEEGYIGQFLIPSDSLYTIYSPNNGVDACGVCNGDNTSCAASLYINNLSPIEGSDTESNYLLDIYLKNSEGVAGFQFIVAGAQATSATGGSAGENNFLVQSSEYMVLGFSLLGTTVPVGDALLIQTELILSNNATQICLSDIIISGSTGNALYLTDHDNRCITLGCTDPEACNYNEASDFDFNCQRNPYQYNFHRSHSFLVAVGS